MTDTKTSSSKRSTKASKAKKVTKKKVTKKKVTKKKKEEEEVDLIALGMKGLKSETAYAEDIDTPAETFKYILPFRSIALNKITGGVPSGHLVEISGISQSGKSFLLYELMAECEAQGGINYLVDPEVAYKKMYGDRVGIKKPFVRSKENAIETIFKDFRKFVKNIRAVNKTCPILLGIDSYQNLSILREIKDEEAGKDRMGYINMQKAATISNDLKTFLTFIEENDIVLILLNTAKKDRSQPKPMFGPHPLTTLAEEVLQFPCNMRIQGRLHKKIRVEVPSLNSAGITKKQVGVVSTWEIIKNRVIEPFKKANVHILYSRGVLKYSGLDEILVQEELVKPASRAKLKTDGTKGKQQEKGWKVCEDKESEEFTGKFYLKLKDILEDYPHFKDPVYSEDFFVGQEEDEMSTNIEELVKSEQARVDEILDGEFGED